MMRRTETEKQPQASSGSLASEKGFTLIETSIAMVIMMVAALGAAALFTYSIGYNSGGNDRAMALSIAQQQMELLRSTPFNDALLNTTSSSGTLLTPIVRNGGSYRITKTVIGENHVSGNPTSKTITIEVRPLSRGFAGFPVILRTRRTTTAAVGPW
jgi:prepilin-type N-terminal cleavage/methylation domain-containing protein